MKSHTDPSAEIALRCRLPEGRSYAQLKNHYEVEKALAHRLMLADRDERKQIYATMYDELFSKVPDHPRLSAADDEDKVARTNAHKLKVVERFVDADSSWVEFAPGDCRFAYFLSERVARVAAVDICDQRSAQLPVPDNFHLEIYDGYELNLRAELADIAFSDQLIEHLHPEDVEHHFGLVHQILRPGGKYVLRTPHAFFGPWDVSKFFSDEPEGFHLHEWTFGELHRVLAKKGFGKTYALKRFSGSYRRVRTEIFRAAELFLRFWPRWIRRRLARALIPRQVVVVAERT